MSLRLIRAALISTASLLLLARAAGGFSDWERANVYREIGDRVARTQLLRAVTGAWPERSRQLAGAIVEAYGVPDEIQNALLVWTRVRPWERIVVFRDAAAAERPNELLEVLAYDMTLEQQRALAGFARGVEYDPVRRELGARSDDERTNFLALNLADEVIQGHRTSAEARALYDRTLALFDSGKDSPAMRGLQFRPRERVWPGSRVTL